MTHRRPQPSPRSAAIPSLTALLAAGAQLAGCHAPACQPNRVEELNTHGHEAVSQARQGHAADALRAIAVATGLTIHPQPPPQMPPDVDGGIGLIDPTPPVPPPVEPTTRITGGAAPPATVTPPTPPTPPPVRHPTRRAGHPPATPPPHYEPHMLGDVGAVLAVPPTEATRRPV